jgi:crotonobetainyl-CoA:carnitine CoA-transferase CaiB-like acyl-CoA transferase
MPLPLEGYTVLDLTRARSGPTAVRQLADMGANVIKVEQREEMEGDSTALGFDFMNLHRNKRSMTLDLKHPRGVRSSRRSRRAPTSSSRTSGRTSRSGSASTTRRCRR